jgi:hypothetical protein
LSLPEKSLYDYRPETPVHCPNEGCGWTGTFGDLHEELRSFQFLSYDCPECNLTVVAMLPPTIAEVRAAAAAGDPAALEHLVSAERAETQRHAWHSALLRSVDDLPNLALPARTRFVWDVETTDETNGAAERTSVIRTADGQLVWRELAPWEGYGRFDVVRRLLRARYQVAFGGLALTERALSWLAGDRHDAARMLGDPPVVPDGSGVGPPYEPVTLLGIGVTCQGGAKFEDPSVDLLADLLRSRAPGDAYLILERVDDTPGDPFIQTVADPDGSWVVEYRNSQDEPVFHAETRDADLVRQVLVEWCLDLAGWHDRLTWTGLDLPIRGLVRVDLLDKRGPACWRSLSARRRDDGGVVIEGQDLGQGVEDAFGTGNREYEWAWSIAPEAIPAAVRALGGSSDDDLLRRLRSWSVGRPGKDPGSFLKEAGVPMEFWNRIGD